MDDAGARLLTALDLLKGVADEATAEEALETLDPAALQEFWRQWPNASAWAGALWRQLNADLGADVDEIGGSG